MGQLVEFVMHFVRKSGLRPGSECGSNIIHIDVFRHFSFLIDSSFFVVLGQLLRDILAGFGDLWVPSGYLLASGQLLRKWSIALLGMGWVLGSCDPAKWRGKWWFLGPGATRGTVTNNTVTGRQ